MAFARDVALSADARRPLDNEIHRFPLLDDIYRALEWRLARQPDVGLRISNGWHVIRSQAWDAPGAAVIVALYQFNENRVEIDRLAVIPI